MAEKTIRRPAIGLAPVQRLLKEGAGAKKYRVSEKAVSAAKKAVEDYLRSAAREMADRAADLKKKTINLDMVIRACCQGCNGVKRSDVERGHVGEKKGFSLAGVVRTVKKMIKLNITKEAQEGILGAAEAYCRQLGRLSAKLLDSSGSMNEKSSDKRTKSKVTIKSSEIKNAVSIARD